MVKGLVSVQAQLKAPKGQFNSFGKYRYRSCEDILTAVKPLLEQYGLQLTLSDEIVAVGGRIYVKATAKVVDHEGNTETVTAYAREPEAKRGMDEAQITGTASSYARKYVLNALFLIDDTKDADTDAYHEQETSEIYTRDYLEKHGHERIGKREAEQLTVACQKSGKSIQSALAACKVKRIEDITYAQLAALLSQCA